ncbi:MAG: polyphosphate kinase 1 [Sandaracinaceae bacterium]|nr:polyphosphate kinase 1 [Sandaracinaceae bacterium]
MSVTPIDLSLAEPGELFLNRELSWLEFNQRVLDEANDKRVPLLERLKFLGICASNLDEFFMVRVAGLLEQRAEQIESGTPDGMTPAQQISAIAARVKRLIGEMSTLFCEGLEPALHAHGVARVDPRTLEGEEQRWLREYFETQVYPVLTPLALDPGHPFPHMRNKDLQLIVMLAGERAGEPAFALLQVPPVLPRVVALPDDLGGDGGEPKGKRFVLLEQLVAQHANELFRGFRSLGAWPFRVLRNFDLSIDEEEAEDLLEVITEEVRRRDRGNTVMLTVAHDCPDQAITLLTEAMELDPAFVIPSVAPLALEQLVDLGKPLRGMRELRDPPASGVQVAALIDGDPFDVISRGDVLLHHPYEAFDPVVELLERAARDPDVLAIKQTLYRTSGDSPVVAALVRAAEQGKHVVALVEIKARFDEENNIHWAGKLEQAGVHVVYGLVGLKTHCKVMLIVRRESGRLRRYVHLGTGNYNPHTARLYTDLSLFTAQEAFGEDATSLFNLLTSCTGPEEWKRLVVAPLGLHERVLGLIARESQNATEGKRARIIAKMNSLVDPEVILALYRASQAGVEIDLIIRGICCLRPGVPGLSERIRVRSIVDRFLEHARVCFFEAGGEKEVYLGSADWMPRNFQRRVEVMFPVEDPKLKQRVYDRVLGLGLRDDTKAHELQADGSYRRVVGEGACRSQTELQRAVLESARRADAEKREERPFFVRPVRIRPTKLAVPTPSVPPPASAVPAPPPTTPDAAGEGSASGGLSAPGDDPAASSE